MINQEIIHHAILTLAGRCDGARTRDGAGFNSYDAPWGHESAKRIEMGDSIPLRIALRVLGKYRRQLAEAGIELPAPEPVQVVLASAPASTPMVPSGVTVSRVGNSLAIRFPYDRLQKLRRRRRWLKR